MDWGRRPYTTKARFFRDDPTEADIVWYVAREDAPAITVPTPFVSSEWDRAEKELGFPYHDGPGEVWNARRRFNGRRAPAAATGAHRCGTDDEWRNGALWNPARPPVLYNADGLPTCCVPGGGLFFGGGPRQFAGGLYFTNAAAEPGGGLYFGSAPPAPGGGLYFGSVPTGGYATRYQVTAGEGAPTIMLRGDPGPLFYHWWYPNPGDPEYRLTSPEVTGLPGLWGFSYNGMFSHAFAEGWDGQGSADFFGPFSGPYVATITYHS